MMDQVAGHKSSKKFTTPSGIEWIYLTSASDGTELEEIRRNNQVHYNSYSEKNAWTKFVCNRNPKTNGNCKYQLLAIKKSAAENPSFNIYWRGVHNHDVIPIKTKPSSAEQGSSTGTEKRHPRSTQKTLAFVIVHRDNPTPSTNGSGTNNAEGEETSGPSSDDSNIALHSICYSYHELENLRRTEGLLIDEQFNVVDGLPEKAFYRCKANTKCPYSLKAYHNKVAGFFEVYAPHPNLHEHNNSDITMTKIKYNKSGQHSHNHAGIGIKEEGDMNKGNGVADPVYSKSALHLRNQEPDIDKRGSHGVNITKRLAESKNAGRKRQATLSFPRNVDIRQWNFVCDLADDAQFEKLRKAKRVVSLKQMGKTFCTLRQQTLKCYRRSSLKGKCPYRILLFRIGAVVKLYEKGAHNHFVPAPSEEYDIPLAAQKKAHGNREMDSIEIGTSVVPEPEETGHSSLRKRRKFSMNSNIESLL